MGTLQTDSTINFVGRKAEQKSFRRLISSHINEPFQTLVLISGPGGYGKTWLTTKLCQIAEQEFQIASLLIDWSKFPSINTISDVMTVIAQKLSEKFGTNFMKFSEMLESEKILLDKIAQLTTDYQLLYLQQPDHQKEFKTWLSAQLNDSEIALWSNRTRTLSESFIDDINHASLPKSLVIAFDTYELIDYIRHGKQRTNFANLWVQRLLKDSPANFIFVIAGRDIDFNPYLTHLAGIKVEPLLLKVFQRIDADEYVRAKLGRVNTNLSRRIYSFSRGVPLLIRLAIESVKEFSTDSVENILSLEEEISDDAASILKVGAKRFLYYLTRNENLLLLTCLIAVTQISEHGSSMRVVEASLDNAKILDQPATRLIHHASASFSSIFTEVNTLHSEIREIIIDVLIDDWSHLFESHQHLRTKFECLLYEAERFLLDSINAIDQTTSIENEDFESDLLFAHLINMYTWIDQQRAIDVFLRECLKRNIRSFQSLNSFLHLLSDARVIRIFPKIVQPEFERLLAEPSRPALHRFLNSLPARLVDTLTCKTLVNVVKLNLRITVQGNSPESAIRLFHQSKVLENASELKQLALSNLDEKERHYELLGLVDALISYANILHELGEHEMEAATLRTSLTLLDELPRYLATTRYTHCYLTLAKASIETEDFNIAREFAIKAQTIAPQDHQVLDFIGKLPIYTRTRSSRLVAQARSLLQGNAKVTHESIKKIDDALNLHPDNLDALNNAIRAYRRIRNYEAALEISGKLLAINPFHVSGIVGRGEVFYEIGQFNHAEQSFRIALKVTKNKQEEFPNIFTNLGRCCMMQAKYEEALIFFNKRLEIGSNKIQYLQEKSDISAVVKANNELRHVRNRKAFALLKLNQPEEAKQLFLEVTKLDNNYQEAWIGLCIADPSKMVLYIQKGVDACRRNIKLNDFKTSYYFHLAILYLVTGEVSAFSKEEHLDHFKDGLSQVGSGYGFVYEALFILGLIFQYKNVLGLDVELAEKIKALLESYVSSVSSAVTILPNSTVYSKTSNDKELDQPKQENIVKGSNKYASTSSKSLLKTKRILLLMSDPSDEVRLRLDEEFREIQEKLRASKQRSRIRLGVVTSVRAQDISQGMLDWEPSIVHFSGHGSTNGALHFENASGESLLVTPDVLAALFAQFASHLYCVVLNACYSEPQAKAIAQHIDYVIGMDEAINDKAAIAFAVGFYQAIGAGKSIEEAFQLGVVQIRLHGGSEYVTPVIIRRGVLK